MWECWLTVFKCFVILVVVRVLRGGYCNPKQPRKMYKEGLNADYNYDIVYNI